MFLYVIRHGETEQGKKRMIASVDELLNETGIKQAKSIAKETQKLPLKMVYVSQIQRAKDTLGLFGLCNIPIIEDERINERELNRFAGVSFNTLNWDLFWGWDSRVHYPDAEGMDSVYQRVKNFIEEISEKDENTLIVTHGGVCRAIDWYFNGIPKDGTSRNVNENCKIYAYDTHDIITKPQYIGVHFV